MKYTVQTSTAADAITVEADAISEKENMFVFTSGEVTTAMFSKSFVQFLVRVDESE